MKKQLLIGLLLALGTQQVAQAQLQSFHESAQQIALLSAGTFLGSLGSLTLHGLFLPKVKVGIWLDNNESAELNVRRLFDDGKLLEKSEGGFIKYSVQYTDAPLIEKKLQNIGVRYTIEKNEIIIKLNDLLLDLELNVMGSSALVLFLSFFFSIEW